MVERDGGRLCCTQFTCFTSTKVQILTQNLQDELLRAEEDILTEEISDAKQQVLGFGFWVWFRV